MSTEGRGEARGALIALVWTLTRFLMVGAINTLVGFGVTMILQLGGRLEPHVANAGGYAVGIVLSFTLNRRFVFGAHGRLGATAARFAATALFAFALNQGVLSLATGWLGRAGLAPVLEQGLAACSYTIVSFWLCRAWVFRAPSPAVTRNC